MLVFAKALDHSYRMVHRTRFSDRRFVIYRASSLPDEAGFKTDPTLKQISSGLSKCNPIHSGNDAPLADCGGRTQRSIGATLQVRLATHDPTVAAERKARSSPL